MKTLLTLASGILLLAVTTVPVSAQGYKGPRPRPSAEARGGPGFCRSGVGHPVHGWRWCADRGWRASRAVLHRRARRARSQWVSVQWRPVHVGYSAAWGRHPVSQFQLESLVGRKTVRKIRKHARRSGLHGPLVAHGLHPRAVGPGFEIWSDGLPVARLIDYDRDGWAEVTLLWTGRRW